MTPSQTQGADDVPVHSDDDEDDIAAREAEIEKKKKQLTLPFKDRSELPSTVAFYLRDENGDLKKTKARLAAYHVGFNTKGVEKLERPHASYVRCVNPDMPDIHKTTVAVAISRNGDEFRADQIDPAEEIGINRAHVKSLGGRWVDKRMLTDLEAYKKNPDDAKLATKFRRHFKKYKTFSASRKDKFIVLSTAGLKQLEVEVEAAEAEKKLKEQKKAERAAAKAEKQAAKEKAAAKSKKSPEQIEDSDMDVESPAAGPAKSSPKKRTATEMDQPAKEQRKKKRSEGPTPRLVLEYAEGDFKQAQADAKALGPSVTRQARFTLEYPSGARFDKDLEDIAAALA